MVKFLNKGFVKCLDVMGTDHTIAESARVSTGSNKKTPEDDEKLIKYMIEHKHTSPFEFAELTFHIKVPIFVMRQWVRHRTANISEISGRYQKLKPEFYVPKTFRLQGETNRQSSYGEVNSPSPKIIVEKACVCAWEDYEELLAIGVCREQARMVLPLNIFTEFYWKIDLHNLLHFLELRLAPEAQEEMKVYARDIERFVRNQFPITHKYWLYRTGYKA